MAAYVEIPLGRSGRVAIVDAADYESVAAYRWTVTRRGRVLYPMRQWREDGRHHSQLMHKLLTGWPRVDHANSDGLDNRRANLRPATPVENARNTRSHRDSTSQFKGVSWDSGRGRWLAQIWDGSRQRHLGRYRDEAAAARAYDEAAAELHGAFARLNLVEGVSR